MGEFLDLRKVRLQTVSPLWKITEVDGEQVLQVTGHTTDMVTYPALIGEPGHNCRFEADMRFLGHHNRLPNAGWFGFVFRAQDFFNHELVWFMPNAESGKTAAYVPVAHGVVPWWTEAYANQQKGSVPIPANDWFRARVDVIEDEFTVYVNDQLVFAKKITYYLTIGRLGLFAGTATDAAFRRIMIEDLP